MPMKIAPARRRLARVAGPLILLAGSVGIGLLLAELGLRHFRPQIFPVHPPGMYGHHTPYGASLTPNFTGRLQRPEFDVQFTVNSHGFRGPELRPRQANTIRIVALGDSQTFGFGVEDGEVFTALLENLLRDRFPRTDFQVINTGSPSFGTYGQLELLRTRWAELEPDLVLLQFLPVNDFQDNRAAARQLQPRVRDDMLTAAAAAGADPVPPAWLRAVYWTRSRLHTARLVSENAGYLGVRLGFTGGVDALWGEDFTEEDEILTRGLLEQVSRTAQAGGARMLFLYSTAKPAMMGSEYRVPRSRAVIERAAASTGAEWLDLNELMRAYERPHRLYFARDGHWSPAGHAAVAEILAEQLSELRLLGSPDRGRQAEHRSGPGKVSHVLHVGGAPEEEP
jgi:lysophospholipase L1-like esterase